MSDETIEKINTFLQKHPIAKGAIATKENINEITDLLGLIGDEDYIEFITNYGGCLIGSVEVYGFTNSELMDDKTVIELTLDYRMEESYNADWLIISIDGGGNYVGIDKDGRVLVEDHDTGLTHVKAENFEVYILDNLKI